MSGSTDSRSGIRLSEDQRLNWLRLIRSENVGPVTFRELIIHFGSASNALEILPQLIHRGGAKKPIRIASIEDAEREMKLAARVGARFVGMGEPDYPLYLRQCETPPPLVAIKGDTSVCRYPPIAIVGARNASALGVRFTHRIASELGAAGYATVSGLARGIDAAAHEASLGTGTIAVLAGGIDRLYPPENANLYRSIPEKGGLLISEMPMNWEPRARDFPRRNRIIAGISLGLVVVEAAERSGSLISARFAGEMGRLVFAVPGSPIDPRAAGTNKLLKNGAILVTQASDIIEAMTPITGVSVQNMIDFSEISARPHNLQPMPGSYMSFLDDMERDKVVNALSPVPIDIDSLVRHTGLQPAQIFLVLLELDLAGRLVRHSGGTVSLLLV